MSGEPCYARNDADSCVAIRAVNCALHIGIVIFLFVSWLFYVLATWCISGTDL